MKTEYFQYRKKIIATGKTFFTLAELAKFYKGSHNSLKVLLSNWMKRGLILHLGRGYYAFDLASVNFMQLATSIDRNAYVSFEYALYYYGLIDQVPSVVTLATEKRSRKLNMRNWVFEYSHLKNELFFGYELKDGAYIASPEKALFDILYLISRGKRLVDTEHLKSIKLDARRLKSVLRRFPDYVMKQARVLGYNI